jgi:hypothetical protein
MRWHESPKQRTSWARGRVFVHAIEEPAKKFYLHFDFEPSPIHELQLMLLMKGLRKSLEE